MKNERHNEGYKDLGYQGDSEAPSLYQILIHNDDYTPMEYVINVLEKFFYLTRRKATDVMLDAHITGRAVCGIFSRDFAEAKISQIIEHARSHEHPLICSMEAV